MIKTSKERFFLMKNGTPKPPSMAAKDDSQEAYALRLIPKHKRVHPQGIKEAMHAHIQT